MLRMALKSAFGVKAGNPVPRHGASVMRGGRLLSVGSNRHGKHAEVDALERLHPDERMGCTVYSVRIARTETHIGMAKPCIHCQEYMRKWGVKKVYYTTKTGEVEVMKMGRAA